MLWSIIYSDANILRVHGLWIAHILRHKTGLWQKKYMVRGWKSHWSRKKVFVKIIMARA